MKIIVEYKIKKFTLNSLLVGIILMTTGLCFGQDNLNEQEVIEFNYTTKNVNKVLPFDEFFSIKLVDIPGSVDTVMVKIYEYDLKNTKFKQGDIVTPADLKGSCIIYETKGWKRATTDDKSAEIPVPYVLKPNRKYIVEVSSFEKTQLNANQN